MAVAGWFQMGPLFLFALSRGEQLVVNYRLVYLEI